MESGAGDESWAEEVEVGARGKGCVEEVKSGTSWAEEVESIVVPESKGEVDVGCDGSGGEGWAVEVEDEVAPGRRGVARGVGTWWWAGNDCDPGL